MVEEIRLMVLAGGFGTRLKAVVADVPKPLAPVGSQPFLQIQISYWIKQGVSKFLFLLHYQAEQMVEFIQSQQMAHNSCDFSYVIEPVPLGTGGSVINAIRLTRWEGDFLLTNADTWLGSGLRDVWNSRSPTIGIVRVANAGRYGTVTTNSENEVQKFLEKDKNFVPGWINSGLYRLSVEDFAGVEVRELSLEKDLFPLWVKERRLMAIQLDTTFIDIGIPDDYFKFCEWMQSNLLNSQ